MNSLLENYSILQNILKMKAADASKTIVIIYETPRRHCPAYHNFLNVVKTSYLIKLRGNSSLLKFPTSGINENVMKNTLNPKQKATFMLELLIAHGTTSNIWL
jgi:hypothetical protein